ncbi:unnamed protein product, partial [Ectocarpus sp. 4 AP-2014]
RLVFARRRGEIHFEAVSYASLVCLFEGAPGLHQCRPRYKNSTTRRKPSLAPLPSFSFVVFSQNQPRTPRCCDKQIPYSRAKIEHPRVRAPAFVLVSKETAAKPAYPSASVDKSLSTFLQSIRPVGGAADVLLQIQVVSGRGGGA